MQAEGRDSANLVVVPDALEVKCGGHGRTNLKKSGGPLPPLAKLQKLAELAAVAPAGSGSDPDYTSRSWLIRRRLTDEQIVELVGLHRSGVGTPALCERFGISKPSVLELLHDQGVRMRRQPLTKAHRARAVRLFEEGLAIKPIAAELGSSFGAVRRVLTRSDSMTSRVFPSPLTPST
ncbi:hypothetical protein [Microbacterium testaceum]|uniref:hypothetical protein n=1 Tax=Microbacterium testaceum TaxID=2033 RepID=UPI003825CE0A